MSNGNGIVVGMRRGADRSSEEDSTRWEDTEQLGREIRLIPAGGTIDINLGNSEDTASPGKRGMPGGRPAEERQNKRLEVPIDQFLSLGMITPADPKSVVAEEYRAIKRPILSYMTQDSPNPGGRCNVVMVTSCREGEGKTYSAVNLALSMAMEANHRVLFIDADVAKASASRLFGIDRSEPGLIDVLRNRNMSIRQAIQPTSVEGLEVLPAGSDDAHASELLASERMSSIVRQLAAADEDRVIVFDSAPLLLTNEANVLLAHVGQVVFVVAAESTSQSMVSEALERLQGPVKVGLLFNKVRKSQGRGYGYGYGYGYGSNAANER